MGDVTTLKIDNRLVPQKDCGENFTISANYDFTSGVANNGQTVELLEFQRAGTLTDARMALLGTLGASATLRLQLEPAAGGGNTDLTPVSGAGAANSETLSDPGIFRFAAGDKIVALVGGANIAADETVELDLVVCHNPVIEAAGTGV